METLTDKSLVRTWIYRSTKELTPEVEADIIQRGRQFVSQWASHGEKLIADFEILYHHFLVFSVDENLIGASGCSIDSSVAFIRNLESEFKLGLLDRMQIGFLKDEKVRFHHFNELSELSKSGAIGKNDLVFNTLVQNRKEFDESFLIAVSESPFLYILSK